MNHNQEKYAEDKALRELRDRLLCVPMEDWLELIKDSCVACGGEIKDPIENYWDRGNWCPACCTKADENVRSHVKDKEGFLNFRDAVDNHTPDPEGCYTERIKTDTLPEQTGT